ncbi:hypothetical protein F4778DRAFT_344735 [Xylariomycetidae sp. FL2044]|nr:hypothetical protein F4778DRAFT_344735 [Xylariomycetidae sp. FL2044]
MAVVSRHTIVCLWLCSTGSPYLPPKVLLLAVSSRKAEVFNQRRPLVITAFPHHHHHHHHRMIENNSHHTGSTSLFLSSHDRMHSTCRRRSISSVSWAID